MYSWFLGRKFVSFCFFLNLPIAGSFLLAPAGTALAPEISKNIAIKTLAHILRILIHVVYSQKKQDAIVGRVRWSHLRRTSVPACGPSATKLVAELSICFMRKRRAAGFVLLHARLAGVYVFSFFFNKYNF